MKYWRNIMTERENRVDIRYGWWRMRGRCNSGGARFLAVVRRANVVR